MLPPIPSLAESSRGIAGKAIAPAVKQQFHAFAEARKRQQASVSLLPVGGIDQAEEVTWFLDRGAEAIQVATAPMLNPHWAMEIRQGMHLRGTDHDKNVMSQLQSSIARQPIRF